MFGRTATRRVMVTRPAGLHARPCLAIATAVRRSRSKVEIRSDRQKVNAGDVVELLSLGAGPGTELVLAAKGADAEATLDVLVHLFDNDFGLSDDPP